MRRTQLSLITAAVSLAVALIWLGTGNAPIGFLWAAISVVWLVVSIVQLRRSDEGLPSPGKLLFRRFSRLIRLWS